MQITFKFKFKNLKFFCEKKTLLTALGFKPKSFNCGRLLVEKEMSDACVTQWLEQSTGNRKTWARIPAQSKASLFPQKDFKFLSLNLNLYEFILTTIGPKIEVTLNGNADYSIEKLK